MQIFLIIMHDLIVPPAIHCIELLIVHMHTVDSHPVSGEETTVSPIHIGLNFLSVRLGYG